MGFLGGFTTSCSEWISGNYVKLSFSALGVILVYVIYKLVSQQLRSLREQGKLREDSVFTIKRVIKWLSLLTVLAFVVMQFDFDIRYVINVLDDTIDGLMESLRI